MPMTEGFGITGDDRIYDFRSFNWASAQLLGVLAPLGARRHPGDGEEILGDALLRRHAHPRRHRCRRQSDRDQHAARGADRGRADRTCRRCASSPRARRRCCRRNGGASRSASAFRSPRVTAAARPRGSRSIPVARGGSAASAVRSPITGSPSSTLTGARVPQGETGHVELGAWDDNDFRYLGDDGSRAGEQPRPHAHRRHRLSRRRRPPLSHRPREGADHPRRRQYLARGDRRRADAARGNLRSRDHRRAGRDLGRGGGELRGARSRLARSRRTS